MKADTLILDAVFIYPITTVLLFFFVSLFPIEKPELLLYLCLFNFCIVEGKKEIVVMLEYCRAQNKNFYIILLFYFTVFQSATYF